MNQNLDPTLPDPNFSALSNKMEGEVEPSTETSLANSSDLTKEQILEKLKNLTIQKNLPSRQEVEALKQAYYKLRIESHEAEKISFLNDGNDEASFVPSVDPSDDVLKEFLTQLKNKRAQVASEEEKIKEENYQKKLQIIESIKQLTESSDDFNKLYKDFKELQQQWTEITLVPASKIKELWKSYQIYSEKFYDLIKINNEFRDYDFKKNLELKTGLCEAVEKLLDDTDIVSAFHQLQNFHNQWREIGPVSKDIREELWLRFKNASTEINKRYQAHFESLKKNEEQNLIDKTGICEQMKTIDYSKLTNFKEWDDKSKEVIELQAKWKTIGFVPKKNNAQIFEEFRKLCDEFFEKKSTFFKGVKDDMTQNLEKKKTLCQQALALKDSADWKNTTTQLVQIQQAWKKIGPVPRKYSDALWKEFVAACDYFFEQKKKNESGQKEEEVANLQAKKDIIAKIKDIAHDIDVKEAIEKLHTLADEWHKIGFVPFREKDKIYKEFHKIMDEHYDRLKIDKAQRRFDDFKTSVLDNLSKLENPKRALLHERDHLVHQYNKIKNDLQTYENNMSFLSLSSKNAKNLFKDVNYKIDDLKKEISLIEKKVEAIDENLKKIVH